VENVERAMEAAKPQPKLFFAHYIWHVLLRGSGDLARKVAVPLLLHAVFGPVPIGVTYITKTVNDRGIWRFLKPEELEGASLESLREDALEPTANWLAQQHEDLGEEVLRDLAGLSDEEARKPYRETLGDLIKAMDWARGEVLKEGDKILAELGVPEEDRGLRPSLLAFVVRRLAAVFKSGESKRCWQRVVFIAGHALAEHYILSRRKPGDVAETLGDALKPCAVDVYLTIDGKIQRLSIHVVRFPYYVETLYVRDLSQIRKIRERLGILTPFADAKAVNAAKKTAGELTARWRRRDLGLRETLYALGLAALAAGIEVDEETADLLLYAASPAVRVVAHPEAVRWVLTALRSLGEKAPHRHVSLLAAASELRMLYPETVQHIYDTLQRLRDRLLETERRWPLVEAIRACSNLLRKHPVHIWDRLEEAVVDMCRLHDEVRKRDGTTAPDGGLSAQRLLDAVAKAYVLAVALESDVLALLVQVRCGLGDLVKEAEAVRSVLDEAVAHPEELRKIMENEDFAKWVTARNITDDPGEVVKDLGTWFTYLLARYKLEHALDERGELDAGKLKEAAEEFEKAAEMHRKLKQWENYLTARGLALRARVLAAKSWEELLERAKGFWELWKEAEEHRERTVGYLAKAVFILGEYLVYLAASGDRERAEDLLKELQRLLDYVRKASPPRRRSGFGTRRTKRLNYVREVSVVARLMLRFFGVGEGANLEEVVDVFGPWLSPEYRPALLMLAGRLQRDMALEECAKLFETELCVNAVAAAADDRVAVEILRSVLEKVAPEARPLLGKVDERTLVEVLTPISSSARLVFMLLAAVEGRADAVRLHGLWGSARFKEPLLRRLFRAVYENCGELNSKGCRMALLKLYYLHF
jgi:tetratricopeptide (TPR) repeat protein